MEAEGHNPSDQGGCVVRDRRTRRSALIVLATAALLAGCSASSRGGEPAAGPGADPAPAAEDEPRQVATTDGALQGLADLERGPEAAGRDRLIDAADREIDRSPSATETLDAEETDDPFVGDAQAAWTLALARHVTGEERYGEAAARIVDDWVQTTTGLENACPDSGGCATSLMVSRAAPGLVFAVDLLRADGVMNSEDHAEFQRWLRRVILPAASDRDNNWGDAGTYLIAVVGAELADDKLLESAADRWRERIDLIEPDGQIPEEIRRGDASLMYSQEALDYKVATADVLSRAGIDVWDARGARGGTLVSALALVAAGIDEPGGWPGGEGDLRVPDPAGLWPIAADRWDRREFARLAADAVDLDGSGHSAVLWTGITHPVER